MDEKDALSEKELILQALAKTGGNKAQASKLLGYSRVTLWKKLTKLGIEVGEE
jgi:DNA-binding NtrC family response regulator